MKKTFLAMLLAGGTMTVFAQDTTMTATDNQMNTMNNMNKTEATNPGTNINTWNGVQTNSTSWAPDRDPSWRWNNYGVWSGSANWNANPNNPYGNTANTTGGVNGTTNMNDGNANMNNQNNMSTDASMNSTGSYSAYGTAVPYLPANVQMRFNQDFPAGANTQYAWNQYGDWYHTHQMSNGRLTQYFYDQRGNGYSLALPVLHSYVPENIISSALNKYGSNLYSISMVKNNAGAETYMIGLLDRGQISTHYLDESGVTVNDVWRTEELNEDSTMQSTQSNAAMGDGSSMNNTNNTDMNQTQSNQQNWDAKKDDKKYQNKKHHNKMR